MLEASHDKSRYKEKDGKYLVARCPRTKGKPHREAHQDVT